MLVAYGTWPYKLEEKFRIPIPPKFRPHFKKNTWIYVKGGVISIYNEKRPWMESKNMMLVKMDSTGRIVLPQMARKSLPKNPIGIDCEWEAEGDHFILEITSTN